MHSLLIILGLAVTLSALGKAYHELGYYTQSMASLHRGREILEQIYPMWHPQVVDTGRSVGGVLSTLYIMHVKGTCTDVIQSLAYCSSIYSIIILGLMWFMRMWNVPAHFF